jgi:transposase-like protein
MKKSVLHELNTHTESSYIRPCPQCPRCKSPTYRIRRKRMDRFISNFIPVQRYKCESFKCNWSGIVRQPRLSESRVM